ncbi:TIGR02757 family protein [candidate division WOR-3 bacterium]|uniref:TIGR02757 family protein n=1 Tax=candidate division WOR-3 bacterium TaxID=2052148 RepID=A0A9D5QCY4_UNCW3|nr:TIGR02757 family protein [candidate division WOR-3 bacterium]MBD3364481.1 TIGR02757 family protein [candidate division WOR-3 bacterium]
MSGSLTSIIPQLESLYTCYNKKEYISPDPLQFLYDYTLLRDREIVGMVASSLAYGGIKQILASVGKALEPMGNSPYDFLISHSLPDLKRIYRDFKHRFAAGEDFALMLWGVKRMIEEYGSLEAGFLAGYDETFDTILSSLINYIDKIHEFTDNDQEEVCYGYGFKHLLPHPEKGGASKRLHLFLRWMVRKDAVDLGDWKHVSPTKLIVPVDLHMHRIALALELTSRKQANLKTALEITAAFREIVPDDPVKYDFVLTRLGIRDDTDMEIFLKSCLTPT